MTGWAGDLDIYKRKPTRIAVSRILLREWDRPMENAGVSQVGGMRPKARMSRYLSIC